MVERITWIDNYKGYLLLMVVLCHINLHFVLVDWSVTFFMPAFFMVSGFLFKVKDSETFMSFLKKKNSIINISIFVFQYFGINPESRFCFIKSICGKDDFAYH